MIILEVLYPVQGLGIFLEADPGLATTHVALVRRGAMVEDDGCVFCEVDREDS